MKNRRLLALVGSICLVLVLVALPLMVACAKPAPAPAPAPKPAPTPPPPSPKPFYDGKTIRLTVGTKPGGGFDLIARCFAARLPEHIPGKPTVIVENMPGAGMVKAMNYLYNVAEPDGLTLATFSGARVEFQLLKEPNAQYDFNKYKWVGAASQGGFAFVVKKELNLSIEDLKQPGDPWLIGATAPQGFPYIFPELLNRYAGANLKVIPGFDGTAAIIAAIERGEVSGMATSYSGASARAVEQGILMVLVVTDKKMAQELGVTFDLDLLLDEDARTFRDISVCAIQDMGRAYAFPPGTPEERVQTVRDAFETIVKDAEFQAEFERISGIPPVWSNVEKIEQTIQKLLGTSPEVVEKYKKLLQEISQ